LDRSLAVEPKRAIRPKGNFTVVERAIANSTQDRQSTRQRYPGDVARPRRRGIFKIAQIGGSSKATNFQGMQAIKQGSVGETFHFYLKEEIIDGVGHINRHCP